MLHGTEPTNSFISLIMIAVFSVAAPVLSVGNLKTGSKLPFEPIICGSLRIPLNSAATHWKQYPTAGAYLAMPSTLSWLSCIAGGEAGEITDKSNTFDIQCIHVRFGIMIDNLIKHSHLQLRPEAGVSGMMVGGDDGIIDIENKDVFANVENEYGIYIGIEPVFTWKKLRFSLPIRAERTFSSPERFDAVIISGLLGYQIEL